MFNLNFTNKYKVVHINNELGNCVIGGAGTYMNELYRYRSEDVGFIYMGLGDPTDDYNISDFMEQKDIMIMNEMNIRIPTKVPNKELRIRLLARELLSGLLFAV